MQLSPEQQQAIEAQKAQCPFCQIVAGKIPSSKVYEDDLFLAILDIRPAHKGHVLILPKEHYPIMPLIPPDTFKKFFTVSRDVSSCIKKALLAPYTKLFIANGAVAGQMSTHFMAHIIPYDKPEDVPKIEVPVRDVTAQERAETISACGPILNAMLQKNLAANGLLEKAAPPGGQAAVSPVPQSGSADAGSAEQVAQEVSDDDIMKLIEQNPTIKQAILASPDGFKDVVKTHPQLSVLFQNKDLNTIIKKVYEQEGREMPAESKQAPAPENAQASHPSQEQLEDQQDTPDSAAVANINVEKELPKKEKKEDKADLDKIAGLFK